MNMWKYKPMYRIIVKTCGNIDWGQDPDEPIAPMLKADCETIDECVNLAKEYRDKYDLSSGNWKEAIIKTRWTNGYWVKIGRVSYNGRVWATF